MIVTNYILEPKKQNLVRVEKNLCSLQLQASAKNGSS
jgi:hypothetical protein